VLLGEKLELRRTVDLMLEQAQKVKFRNTANQF
jgi:hypothetical protein